MPNRYMNDSAALTGRPPKYSRLDIGCVGCATHAPEVALKPSSLVCLPVRGLRCASVT